MYVRDERDRAGRLNLSKGLRRIHIRRGAPRQLATRLGQSMYLGSGGGNIASICIAHGLDRAGRAAAHKHISNPDLSG